jgi:AraC family transcriptional activator of tynA and feaB
MRLGHSASRANAGIKWRTTMREDGNNGATIFDTQDFPSDDKGFERFRAAVENSPVPWALERTRTSPFNARVVNVDLGHALLRRVRASGHVGTRCRKAVSRSRLHGVLVVYLLDGNIAVAQGGHESIAQAGDLVLIDTAQPATASNEICESHESINLFIPGGRPPAAPGGQLVFPRADLNEPLTECLSFLANNLATSSKAESSAVYDACVALLPLAARPRADVARRSASANDLMRRILAFVDHNLPRPDLSPPLVAGIFGISDRYVHRLFARAGTTFGTYVANQRLIQIHRALASPDHKSTSPGDLALQWGFRDVSAFNRAFQARYGSPPRHFRRH